MTAKSLLFFGILFLKSVEGYETVDCLDSRAVIPIDNNSYTLVQSPNFPKNFSTNLSSCKLQFRANDANVSLWLVMLNGVANQINFFDDATPTPKPIINYLSNYEVITYASYTQNLMLNVSTSLTLYTQWTAFQAAIITFPSKVDSQDCPLMSQTFDFSSNPNQVIPLSPIFRLTDNQFANKKCNWFFTINSSQKLKIAVKQIELLKDVTLNLNNGSTAIKTFANTDNSQTFYFLGTSFNLAYNYGSKNNTNLGFFIFVSAVTQTNTETFNGCQKSVTNTTNQITVYSNIDYENGYLPNQHCVSSVEIPTNHEGVLAVSEYEYEEISDKLMITFAPSYAYPITWRKDAKVPYEYVLTPDIKFGNLDFRSDGNTQGAGFTAELSTYECKCANPNFMISCGEFAFLGPLEDTSRYCSNMDCNYTVVRNPQCNDTYFYVYISNSIRPSIDYLLLKDNGAVIQNITSFTKSNYMYYSPNSNIQLTFHSGPSDSPISTEFKSWSTSLRSIKSPNFVKKTLNAKNATHVQWLAEMGQNDALSVCATTGTLELFVTSSPTNIGLSSYLLYDSNDLANFVGSLDILNMQVQSEIPSSRKSTSKCFTIYSTDSTAYTKDLTALFRIVEETTKNCNSENNVFQMKSSYSSVPDYTVSASASPAGPCEIMIIASADSIKQIPSVWISNISVSSDSTFSFSSTVNGNPLLELSSADVDQWQSFGIYTPSLSITIPPSASLSVQLSNSAQLLHYISVLANGAQKGIMASPSYSGFKGSFTSTQLYTTYGYSNFDATFVVKDIYGNAVPYLSTSQGNILSLDHNLTVTKVSSFFLNYEETLGNLEAGFRIEYKIVSSSDEGPNSGNLKKPEISLLMLYVFFCFILML